MSREKGSREISTSGPGLSGPARRRRPRQDGAFDLWLARGLHQLFDEVASEPIPEELLKLIQDDEQQG